MCMKNEGFFQNILCLFACKFRIVLFCSWQQMLQEWPQNAVIHAGPLKQAEISRKNIKIKNCFFEWFPTFHLKFVWHICPWCHLQQLLKFIWHIFWHSTWFFIWHSIYFLFYFCFFELANFLRFSLDFLTFSFLHPSSVFCFTNLLTFCFVPFCLSNLQTFHLPFFHTFPSGTFSDILLDTPSNNLSNIFRDVLPTFYFAYLLTFLFGKFSDIPHVFFWHFILIQTSLISNLVYSLTFCLAFYLIFYLVCL